MLEADRASAEPPLAAVMPRMEEWTRPDLLMIFAMWSVMMVGMMVPSVSPVLLLFAAVNRKRREQRAPFVPTGLFLAGYLASWTFFAAAATGAQWGLHSAALLSPMMVASSPALAGALLVAAGLFQWTPLKRACLRHCRSPLEVVATGWREGKGGAVRMGLKHGLFCVGCCWVLMTLLFALGVMNLLWVAVIAAFVLVEKAVPGGQLVGRVAGVLLALAGLGVLLIR